MELDKFETKQVAVISELQARSNELRGFADNVVIQDDDSLKEASALIKEINAHKKFVADKRMELTRPLKNVIDQLIAKEKEVLHPLDEGKNTVSEKILAYQEELEKKRLAEQARVDAIIDEIEAYEFNAGTLEEIEKYGPKMKEYYSSLPESDQLLPAIKSVFLTSINKLADRKAQFEEQLRLEEERKRQAEEDARLKAEAEKQSAEEARIAAERRALDEEKRRIENEKADIEREKARIEREKEQARAAADAEKARKAAGKSTVKVNAVTQNKFEIVDADAVSRAYCSPDESKIREAIKNGVTTIAGVRIYQETKVR